MSLPATEQRKQPPPLTQRRFLFVGERPSLKAAAIGATWQNGRLSAKNLREAIEAAGFDPAAQEYLNLWPLPEPAEGDTLWCESVLRNVRVASANGREIVGMGDIVCRVLRCAGIVHRQLVHPAARGAIRKTETYRAHVAAVLTGEVTL